MKGAITLKILEAIGNIAVDTTDLFVALLSSGYGASLGHVEYELQKQRRNHEKERAERGVKQRYYSMLYQLERQGLIERKRKGDTMRARLTKAGKEKLPVLRERLRDALPSHQYGAGEGNARFVIVAFDIPEHSKRKRAWLRSALTYFGMRMIQKSVWAGTLALPRQFLDDLRDYKLLGYVEIFEISKTGSLLHFD